MSIRRYHARARPASSEKNFKARELETVNPTIYGAAGMNMSHHTPLIPGRSFNYESLSVRVYVVTSHVWRVVSDSTRF